MADGDALTFHKLLEGEHVPVPNGIGFVRTAGGAMRIVVTGEADTTEIPLEAIAQQFEAVFANAAQWIVNHNLGRRPASIALLTVGGVEIEANIVHTSENQFVVDLNPPIAGQVIVQ